jgi:hypothetical protein
MNIKNINHYKLTYPTYLKYLQIFKLNNFLNQIYQYYFTNDFDEYQYNNNILEVYNII